MHKPQISVVNCDGKEVINTLYHQRRGKLLLKDFGKH